MRVSPQPTLRLSRFSLKALQRAIPWRILPIPPASAVFDQRMIDVGAIRQKDISNGTPVPVLTVGLECDFPTKH